VWYSKKKGIVIKFFVLFFRETYLGYEELLLVRGEWFRFRAGVLGTGVAETVLGRRIVDPKKTGITNAKNLTIIYKSVENLTKSTMKCGIGNYLGRSPGVESSEIEVTELAAET
tara:strand:+ start:239 stop:580 length:342 start_codon:yes stop_codon:yes gene_type:complete